ncbi:MAG: site-2 protease family protein [Chloroflexi bacterium]|nr:site-2 protease family protein [Chloroflexota bacterium]
MHNAIHIGKIFGINIYVDWSWIFIFLLVLWELAAGVFPQLHPQWGPGLIWSTAFVASLLFFASVLAHELAHSLVAKANGIPVHDITLFLFGGVSNIQREPTSPAAEFVMAVVGPLTSIVLGVIFLLLSGAVVAGLDVAMGNLPASLAQLDPLSTLLLWLGPINILLGVFNLIPGFPLDGGRVLRSIFWAASKNLRRATQWASWVGQAIAWILIVAGISMVFGMSLPFFGTGLIGGLWLAFIGWFLNNAAVQSYQQVVVEDLLEGVTVAQLMHANTPTVSSSIPVSSLVHDHILGTDERAFPVVDNDRLVGFVCIEDVRKVPREKWDTTTVGEIMTPANQLVVATPGEEASAALNDLALRDVNQLPVVQDGRLVGTLRRRDIMRWLQLHSGLTGRETLHLPT